MYKIHVDDFRGTFAVIANTKEELEETIIKIKNNCWTIDNIEEIEE